MKSFNTIIKQEIDKISTFLKTNNFNFIAIALGGSSSCPDILNAHDIDVIYLFDDTYNTGEIRRKFFELYTRENTLHIKLDQFDLDAHFTNIKKAKMLNLDCLPLQFIYLSDNISGSVFNEINSPDIITNKDKYLQALVTRVNRTLNRKPEDQLLDKCSKKWYRFYYITSIIKNNSYELTSDQIVILNLLHNQRDEDRDRINTEIDKLITDIKELSQEYENL